MFIVLKSMYETMSISTGLYPNLDLWNANKLHYITLQPVKFPILCCVLSMSSQKCMKRLLWYLQETAKWICRYFSIIQLSVYDDTCIWVLLFWNAVFRNHKSVFAAWLCKKNSPTDCCKRCNISGLECARLSLYY